jgi:hypothetical protein
VSSFSSYTSNVFVKVTQITLGTSLTAAAAVAASSAAAAVAVVTCQHLQDSRRRTCQAVVQQLTASRAMKQVQNPCYETTQIVSHSHLYSECLNASWLHLVFTSPVAVVPVTAFAS